MKKLAILFCFFSAGTLFAAGGGGGSIFPIRTSMNGQKPAEYTCDTFKSGAFTGLTGVPLTTGASACPGGACTNPGYFAPYWETYQFKNTLLQPQCITINWTAQTAAFCNISFAYTGTGPILLWTPTGAPCYGPPINMGSPGAVCMGTSVSYSLTIPECSPFTVFLANNNGSRNTYDLNIFNDKGDPAAIGCLGAECKKLITIGGTPVPTMTQWGLFIFGLVLLTFASVAIYNFAQRASVKE